MSVASVTPPDCAVSPEETASADDIALGLDGDAQATIPSPPNTMHQLHARLNTFDMLDLWESGIRRNSFITERPTLAGRPTGKLFYIAHLEIVSLDGFATGRRRQGGSQSGTHARRNVTPQDAGGWSLAGH